MVFIHDPPENSVFLHVTPVHSEGDTKPSPLIVTL